MNGGRKRTLWIVAAALLALGAACGIYLGTGLHAAPEAAALLQGSDAVRVEAIDGGYLLDGPGEEDAFIFYPGGKVEPAAYLPLLMTLAEEGVDCFLIKMPLDLAVFDSDAAASIQDAYAYERWYMGGHSLGGACAALYAAENEDRLAGLVLLAAYATKPIDEDLAVLELHGSEDGVLNREKLEEGKRYLPASAISEELPGGNHAQFGDYGPQKGDGDPTVSREEQTAWAADRIVRFIAP